MVLLSKMADTADSVVSFTPRYNSSRTVFIPLIRAVASEGAAQYIHEYYSQDYGIVMYTPQMLHTCLMHTYTICCKHYTV